LLKAERLPAGRPATAGPPRRSSGSAQSLPQQIRL
jgi:hypothetical protein